MATGPEHYAEAERLLEGYAASVKKIEEGQPFATPAAFEDARLATMLAQGLLAKAQVHATLAQAAATVANRYVSPVESWGGYLIEVAQQEGWDPMVR